jgi:DNA-binding transcriptional regulator YhcF (GntR family)
MTVMKRGEPEVAKVSFTPLKDDMVAWYGLIPAAIIGYIGRRAMGPAGYCTASVERMAKDLSVSRATVNRHLVYLKAEGVIEDNSKGIVNKPHELKLGPGYEIVQKGMAAMVREEKSASKAKPVVSQSDTVVSQSETPVSQSETVGVSQGHTGVSEKDAGCLTVRREETIKRQSKRVSKRQSKNTYGLISSERRPAEGSLISSRKEPLTPEKALRASKAMLDRMEPGTSAYNVALEDYRRRVEASRQASPVSSGGPNG